VQSRLAELHLREREVAHDTDPIPQVTGGEQ
jgi:hypothetical protein